jgi:glyoxylase-like metal-dependent hydrolase (beta-lactamase superfamily II)
MSAVSAFRRQGPGRIDNDLYLLGEAEVPVWLLQTGPASWALVEGGISASAGAVWEQLLAIVGDPSHVTHWLITHKHYDHCALLPYLAPRLPNVRILASAETARAWRSEKALAVIDALNARVGAAPAGFEPRPWAQLAVTTVAAGDTLELGPLHALQVVAAPGHASDQILYYDAQRARLFASDALGELDDADGVWRPLVFDDYALYLRTLETLCALPVRQLIPGHGGMLTGAAAANGALDALRECRRLEQRIRWRLDGGAALDHFSHELHSAWAPQSASFVPADLHLASMRRMNGLIAAAASSLSRS